jgi:hypothetical protein
MTGPGMSWWHASTSRLAVGDWIEPSIKTGHRASWIGVDPGDQYDPSFVYLIEANSHHNVRGRFSFSGHERFLYRVRPLGERHVDPDETMRWKNSWCFDRAQVLAVFPPGDSVGDT